MLRYRRLQMTPYLADLKTKSKITVEKLERECDSLHRLCVLAGELGPRSKSGINADQISSAILNLVNSVQATVKVCCMAERNMQTLIA